MKINDLLINKNQLASLIGMKSGTISSKLQNANGTNFTEKQLTDMQLAFEDLFCYIFEVDEIEIIHSNISKSIKLDCNNCKHHYNPKSVYAKACYDCGDFCNHEKFTNNKIKGIKL